MVLCVPNPDVERRGLRVGLVRVIAPEQRLGVRVVSDGGNSSWSEAWFLPCACGRPCEQRRVWGAGCHQSVCSEQSHIWVVPRERPICLFPAPAFGAGQGPLPLGVFPVPTSPGGSRVLEWPSPPSQLLSGRCLSQCVALRVRSWTWGVWVHDPSCHCCALCVCDVR